MSQDAAGAMLSVSGLTFGMMLNPALGVVNQTLLRIGITGPGWATDTTTALLTVILIDVWQWTPFCFVIIHAGFRSLSSEQREAARVDGANTLQVLVFIVIPLISVGAVLVAMAPRDPDLPWWGLAAAVTLAWRARHDDVPRAPRVPAAELNLSRVAVVSAAALMVTGPLVTGSGPHAGDAEARRFGYHIPDVVRVHSINMWVFLAVVVVLLVLLARRGAPADVLRRGGALLAAIVAQGAIGYMQYALGIPEWVVLAHIAGATTVLGVTVWFHLGLSGPAAEAAEPATAAGTSVAPVAGVGR